MLRFWSNVVYCLAFIKSVSRAHGLLGGWSIDVDIRRQQRRHTQTNQYWMTPILISCCLHTSLSSPELPKGERHRHIKDDLNPFRQEGCRLNPVEASRSNSRGGFQRVMVGTPIRRHFFLQHERLLRERFPGEREAIIQAINSRVRFNRSHNSIRFLIYIDVRIEWYCAHHTLSCQLYDWLTLCE